MSSPNHLCQADAPLVSVVMPAKNEEKYIGAAIESVLRQTYPQLDLIVVDDYSDDGTSDVVRSFSDPRVRLYRKRSEGAGQAVSKNIGAQLARGSLVAYQDADDYSDPRRLELQVAEFQAGERPRVVGSWIEQRIGSTRHTWRLPVKHDEIVAGFSRFYNRVTFVAGTILFPRSLALAVPNRERFRYFEDWDQLCRLHELSTVEFRNVPEVLYTYNVRPKGSKGQREWSQYNIFERACRARRSLGLPEWASAEEFEAHLNRSPLDFLRWRGIQQLLQLKVEMERVRIRRRARLCEEQG